MWSEWPWVISITSMRSNFLRASGHFGFVSVHGSIRMTLPEGVVILNVAWPSQVILFPRVRSMKTPPSAKLMIGSVRCRASGAGWAGAEELLNCFFEFRARPRAYERTENAAVGCVKHGRGDGAVPARADGADKFDVVAGFESIIRESRLVPGKKAAHQ